MFKKGHKSSSSIHQKNLWRNGRMNCGSNTIPSDRYQDNQDWLGSQIENWQKASLPWVETAARVILIVAGLTFAPKITLVSFAVGAAAGYRWPGEYDINPAKMAIGCSQNFYEVVANRKLVPVAALIISTLDKLDHMRHHGKYIAIPVAGYSVGQYVGKEINAWAKKNLHS
jgi:hypothetical protein